MPGTYGTSSSETVRITGQVKHPLKGTESSSVLSKTNFLVATFSNSSTIDDSETFASETYRLKNINFVNYSSIQSATWDSTIPVINGGAGYEAGMVQYNGNLIVPSKAGVNGDFTTIVDGGIYQGPAGNPDYSDVANHPDEFVYYRSFHNVNASDYQDIDINITGTGILAAVDPTSNNSTHFPNANNTSFRMFVKLVEPSENSNTTTGWKDCGNEWTGSVADNTGCSTLPANQLAVNISTTTTVPIRLPSGRFLYGSLSGQSTNYLIIKIVAHKNWTGRITSLGVSF